MPNTHTGALTRRRFLQTAAITASTPAGEQRKYLLLDSRVVERTSNAGLVLGTVRKDPAHPLFAEDKPWEPRFDNLYANVILDREEGIYKCWYSPFIVDPATTNTPRGRRAEVKYRGDPLREMGICYATSKDGIRWEKPSLGRVEFEGSRDNNLLLRANSEYGEPHGAGIAKDPRDPDPGRRYKMFFNRTSRKLPHDHPGYRHMCVGFSANGLDWGGFHPCPEIEAPGDTHSNWFRAPELNRYVGITRLFGEGQRLVARTESSDFLHWTKAQVVLRALPEEPNRQTYAMPAFPYAGVYLGLVMMINKNGRMDTVDCELAWSPDSLHWERVCAGTPLIPRGPEGAHDSQCLYGAFRPVVLENEIRLYYGGNNGEHTDYRDGFFCLARLRPDGFAAMAARGRQAGEVVTRPVRCAGRHLRVSADAAGGSLTASLLDSEGRVLAESQPLRADVTGGGLRWMKRSDLASLRGRDVRIRFRLENCRLYAFQFES